jgi:hypothetical protein
MVNLNCGPMLEWWTKMQEHLGNIILDNGDVEGLEETF